MDIVKNHFSLEDWDFRPGAYLEIATDQYISPPSSLRVQENPPSNIIERVYLKNTLAPNIPDGRIIMNHRLTDPAGNKTFGYLIRCQDTPFATHPDNCYRLHLYSANYWLYKTVNGTDTLLKEGLIIPSLQPNIWYPIRFTFYQYVTAIFNRHLRFIFEIKEDGLWVEKWNFVHTDNLWADSGINRIGFYLYTLWTTQYQWVDDTEIWKKV